MKKLLYIAILSALLLTPAKAQNGNWEVCGTTTQGLSGGQAVIVDSVIYVLGGYSDSVQAAVDWVRTFNPLTGKYTLVGKMKKRRAFHTAVAIGKNIYYAGGEYYNTREANGTIEVFNTENFTSSFIDSNKTFNRYLMASVVVDSSIYFIGGDPYQPPAPHGGVNYPYIVVYSLSENRITYQYTAQFSNSALRDGQMVAVHGPNIYIFGGSYNTILSNIYRFNFVTRQLVKLNSNLLIPRTNGGAFKIPNSVQVLIYGGLNESSPALNSVEKYTLVDSMSMSAGTMNPLNFRRRNLMSVHYQNALYVWGGTNEFGQFVKSIERLPMPLTGIEKESDKVFDRYLLKQNYPNPFGQSDIDKSYFTNIDYYLPCESAIRLSVYNILGEEVTVLVNSIQPEGSYTVSFNAAGLTPGVYFYRMAASPAGEVNHISRTFSQTNKMIFSK